ncbi:MAG: nucleotidyltransferase domain-containing protein, partial [Clostridia bacterium]|nr:nucleotidyltransferase domain-containing protein [Deltaproteobacteria bacterium]
MSIRATWSWPCEGAYRRGDPPLPILKEVIALAKSLVDPSAIYLFGSRARGDFHRLSDIDIGMMPRR